MEKKEWGKYAKTYHSNIISPLLDKVTNPLFNDINNISNSKELIVADLGTGIGDLLPFLSENFKEVYAIDFSKKMIDAAKEKHSTYPNIKFEQADIRERQNWDLNLMWQLQLIPFFSLLLKTLKNHLTKSTIL